MAAGGSLTADMSTPEQDMREGPGALQRGREDFAPIWFARRISMICLRVVSFFASWPAIRSERRMMNPNKDDPPEISQISIGTFLNLLGEDLDELFRIDFDHARGAPERAWDHWCRDFVPVQLSQLLPGKKKPSNYYSYFKKKGKIYILHDKGYSFSSRCGGILRSDSRLESRRRGRAARWRRPGWGQRSSR
jgi:hypothetical protein